MLLVDDDQAEPLDRREHGRARPDADARLALAQPPPLGVALARAQLRVQHRDRLAEAFDEAPDDLRRQRDLGHEHDRAAPLLERRLGGAQVDLRLARAGDPVQQARVRRALARAPAAASASTALLLVVQRRRLGRRAPTGRCSLRLTARRLRPLSLRVAPGGSTSAERARERRAVLRGDPFGERDHLGRHAELERAQRREQLLRGDLAVSASPTTTPSTSRRPNGTTSIEPTLHGPAAQLLGQAVVERPAQRAGRRHRLDLGDADIARTLDRPAARARRRRAARRPCRCAPT